MPEAQGAAQARVGPTPGKSPEDNSKRIFSKKRLLGAGRRCRRVLLRDTQMDKWTHAGIHTDVRLTQP